MKNQALRIVLISILLTVASIMILYNNSNTAEKYYTEYLELAMNDRKSSIINYHHYEIPLAKEMALASSNNKLYSYEILSIERLSNQLWAFTVFMVTDIMRDGATVTNFVGEIEGNYYVMTSVYQIPDSLQSGLDLGKYVDPEAIDFSDIIPIT